MHSRYTRTLADPAKAGRKVRLQLCVRRFFCANPACERRTFTERLPDVVAPWAQRSQRLAETQRGMGLALGGEAAARRLVQLGMPTSPDTVLRLVKQCRQPTVETPHVLGVDDFAWKKRQTYGTILVDLEQHRVRLTYCPIAPPIVWQAGCRNILVSRLSLGDRAGSYAGTDSPGSTGSGASGRSLASTGQPAGGVGATDAPQTCALASPGTAHHHSYTV